MGAVTVSGSSSQTPFASFSSRRSPSLRRPFSALSLKPSHSRFSAFLAPEEPATTISPPDTIKKPLKKRLAKAPKRVNAVISPAAGVTDLDYNQVAVALENLYKLSPELDEETLEKIYKIGITEVEEESEVQVGRRGRGRKRVQESEEETEVVRNRSRRRARRPDLERRVAMRKLRKEKASEGGGEEKVEDDEEDVEKLVREYSASADLVSWDWKKMKIPRVLSSTEQARLFRLMQPMKAILEVKENLQRDLEREPVDGDLALRLNNSVPQIRRHIEVGQAARNKLIKHNLRLVLFVIKKYFQEFASGEKFQDLCQAGVKGLIIAIDRFEPKRGFRLSTYGLFWIRHSIARSMTISSFTRVSFGVESVRSKIQKTKLKLMFELGKLPTYEEIIARLGITPEKYHDVMKTSKAIISLNARHVVTQEEFIDGIADVGVGGDKHRQPALLRLALDDVLDSLKPKESLVIRQRFGLDGKGDRTLGEIAGNLNISREMVRKYELKALMKLKHPVRVDYLRRYI